MTSKKHLPEIETMPMVKSHEYVSDKNSKLKELALKKERKKENKPSQK